jgi:hypothetical protein
MLPEKLHHHWYHLLEILAAAGRTATVLHIKAVGQLSWNM